MDGTAETLARINMNIICTNNVLYRKWRKTFARSQGRAKDDDGKKLTLNCFVPAECCEDIMASGGNV